jgi:hypothetical protein
VDHEKHLLKLAKRKAPKPKLSAAQKKENIKQILLDSYVEDQDIVQHTYPPAAYETAEECVNTIRAVDILIKTDKHRIIENSNIQGFAIKKLRNWHKTKTLRFHIFGQKTI